MSLQSSAVTMTKQMIQIESTDPGTYENAMADWITTQLAHIPMSDYPVRKCFPVAQIS